MAESTGNDTCSHPDLANLITRQTSYIIFASSLFSLPHSQLRTIGQYVQVKHLTINGILFDNLCLECGHCSDERCMVLTKLENFEFEAGRIAACWNDMSRNGIDNQ